MSPGPTQTGWISPEHEEKAVKIIPLGELIKAEQISDAILFLASNRAQMITGQIIKVSGGHAIW